MKHRWKRYGILLILVLIVLGLAYSEMFAPTGYSKVESRGTEAHHRIEDSLRAALAARGRKAEPQTSPKTAQASAPGERAQATSTGEVDFCETLNDLTAEFRQQWSGKDNLLWRLLWMSAQPWSFSTSEGNFIQDPRSGGLIPGPELKRRIFDIASSEFARREESFRLKEAELARLKRIWSGKEEKNFLPAMGQALDRTENLLLHPSWKLPERGKIDVTWFGLDQFATLAIMRAAMRNQPEKVVDLTTHFVELTCARAKSPNGAMIPGYFDFPGIYNSIQDSLMKLDHLQRVPGEGMERVRTLLDRFKLSPDELADRKLIYIQGIRESLQAGLAKLEFSNKSNTWHRLLGGFPEYLVRRPLYYVARRDIDQTVAAWVEGKEAETQALLRKLTTTGMLMNLESDSWISSDMNPLLTSSRDLEVGLYDHRDLTRFMLAAVRYRQAHGKYPDRVEDLIPGFLDPSFADANESTWLILGDESRPIFCQFHRLPESWSAADAKRNSVYLRGQKTVLSPRDGAKPRLVLVNLSIPFFPKQCDQMLELLK